MSGLENAVANLKFQNASEAVSIASYVEQILSSEHNWVTNRLSWLFVSQSFCLTAYAILLSSNSPQVNSILGTILKIGLPILGIITALIVGVSVRAAGKVVRFLANERAKLSHYINTQTHSSIPLLGVDEIYRQASIHSTIWHGALPELLPWVLIPLWVALLLGLYI